MAPTEPLLGLPPERHAAWGTSVGLAVWIIPWALGCSVVSVPGAWHLAQAGAAQGGCWLGERELDKRGALLAGPPPTRTGGLSAGLQDPQGQSARKVRSHQCGSPCDEWTHTGQRRATRPVSPRTRTWRGQTRRRPAAGRGRPRGLHCASCCITAVPNGSSRTAYLLSCGFSAFPAQVASRLTESGGTSRRGGSRRRALSLCEPARLTRSDAPGAYEPVQTAARPASPQA